VSVSHSRIGIDRLAWSKSECFIMTNKSKATIKRSRQRPQPLQLSQRNRWLLTEQPSSESEIRNWCQTAIDWAGLLAKTTPINLYSAIWQKAYLLVCKSGAANSIDFPMPPDFDIASMVYFMPKDRPGPTLAKYLSSLVAWLDQKKTVCQPSPPLNDADPTAFRAAKEFVKPGEGFKDIHKTLKKNEWIRTHKPSKQRLLIHAGDWAEAQSHVRVADPLDLPAEDVDKAAEEVQKRKTEERAKKLTGK
jgi:hypothetical protein